MSLVIENLNKAGPVVTIPAENVDDNRTHDPAHNRKGCRMPWCDSPGSRWLGRDDYNTAGLHAVGWCSSPLRSDSFECLECNLPLAWQLLRPGQYLHQRPRRRFPPQQRCC